MSRLARIPVRIADQVAVSESAAGIEIKGPKGAVRLTLLPGVRVSVKDGGVAVEQAEKESAELQQNVGTMWALIRNAVEGVSQGFTKILEIEGVGFRAVLEGKELVLHLGFVNPIRFPIPEGIAIGVEKGTLKISGVSRELVGETAARIRALKEPEPYKGKGIRYQGEVIRRKVGKRAESTAAAS